MAIHSSVLAWRISWTEEPGGLQSMGFKESHMTEATEHARAAFQFKETKEFQLSLPTELASELSKVEAEKSSSWAPGHVSRTLAIMRVIQFSESSPFCDFN